jgi:PAS domain S-box-containing protein
MKPPRNAKKPQKTSVWPRDKSPLVAPGSALPSNEETWRILEDLPVAVAVAALDDNPRLLFLNKQFTETFGYTLADMPTQEDWARLAYPDAGYREEVFAKWNAAVERATRSQGSVESMEFRVTAKDGRVMDILFNAIVLGRTIQVTLSDLTLHREAERQLVTARRALERTALEVTENIPAGTYTMLLKPGEEMARFTFMSSRFLEICGLDRQAAEENPFNAFACVHPDDYDEWVRKNGECFEKRIPFSEECRIVVRGTTQWILAESIPRELPDGSLVWEGVLTDITRRKTAEAELAALRESEQIKEKQARDNLEKKLRAGLAASAAAHEINQPLARILITAQLVVEREASSSARGGSELSSFVRQLADEARYVVDTIEKMKSIMRNTGTTKRSVDLREIADASFLYAGSFARNAKIHLAFDRPDQSVVMKADADQIQIALNNLLRNAVEAVSSLPARRRRKIVLALRPRKDGTELVVGDSGRGLPADADIDALPKSTKPGGTGLGLFIVRTAAENHGAKLEIGNSPLGGAEFRIVFPRLKRDKGKKRTPKD